MMLCLLVGSVAYAQTPQAPQEQQQVSERFTELELQKFVDVYVQVNEVQKENNAAIQEAIVAESLDMERFNEIARAGQQQDTTANITEEEILAFNNAAQKVKEVQMEAQTKIREILTAEQLSQEKFKEIITAYQQDPEMQKKITVLLQEKLYGE